MSVLDNFETWKDFLANRLGDALQQGLGEETITNLAYEVGDYLASNVEAKNPEEAMLRELWNAASEEEQHAIASTMVKLVQDKRKA
ncbi:DUF3243 domain-containing protein [Ornithinibacillus sp. 4-3]|uniref:DUF3243 domain-containing protein n=1 Tax=Ornithinibacillus sp. 4-3 TaxID=3231488 RepID=A0AB39HU21_9BACI